MRMCRWLLFILVAASALTRPASAQVASDFFRQKCSVCHTIGRGQLIGPDLKNVTKQKDRAWLEHFIQNPKAVLDAGDAYALNLQNEAQGMVMPTIAGVTPEMAAALLGFIEAESGRSKPLSAGGAPGKIAKPPGSPKSTSKSALAVKRGPNVAEQPRPSEGPAKAEVSPPAPSLSAPQETAPAAKIAAAPSLPSPPKQPGEDFFQQNCVSCHTIGGGRLIGPDLKEAVQEKDRAWLENFIQDPEAVLNSGDPYALQLKKDANGIVMPKMPGMTPGMAKALLDMIEVESKLPKSSLGGVSVSEQPFTANDVLTGTEIFLGGRKLSQGGPPCVSCHTLGLIGGLGGGRLGPDLTLVYQRLGGRKPLGAWLSAPATSTMQSVFRNHSLQSEEILPLLAVFEDSSRQSHPANANSQINFFLVGLAGAVLGLAFMGWIWRGRMRTVRRALVSSAHRGAA